MFLLAKWQRKGDIVKINQNYLWKIASQSQTVETKKIFILENGLYLLNETIDTIKHDRYKKTDKKINKSSQLMSGMT